MLMKIKEIFSTDKSYKHDTDEFTKIDAIIAIIYYIFLIFVYYFMGRINYKKNLYLGIYCNVVMTLICFAIIKFRKQSLASIGITTRNIKKSIILGLVTGIAVVIFKDVIPAIIDGRALDDIKNIVSNILYYFAGIAFIEEVMFRGFIQTRIYGLIKNDVMAVIAASIMFSSLHIPFHMASVNVSLDTFLSINIFKLILLCFMHILFNFLYRKYNNIWGSTIFHGFIDLGDSLFK